MIVCFVQSLDLQMKMVSDNMQDKKQKGRAAESDESIQGNLQNLMSISLFSFLVSDCGHGFIQAPFGGCSSQT